MTPLGWACASIVLAGVLTAWMQPSSGGLLHAAVLSLAGMYAVVALALRVRVPWHGMALFPLACAAWGVVQAATGWTVYSFATWGSATAWLARASVFAVAYAAFQDRRQRCRLCSMTVWFAGLFSLLTVLQWYTGGGSVLWMFETGYKDEIAGTFANRDQYAALMELLLPFALAASISGAERPLVATACAGLAFASVVVTGSRAGTALVCLEVLVFSAAACLGPRRNARAAALAGAIVLASVVVGGWSYIWERFSAADPFAFRREMLIATVDMIRTKPLTGFGLGTWPTVYPAFAVFDPPGVYMNHAHNDWAEWTAEGGVVMPVLLLGFALAAARIVWRHPWALGILAVLAHAVIDFPMQKPALACALFFYAGVAAAAAREASAGFSAAESVDFGRLTQ